MKQLIENIVNEYKQEPAYYNSPDGLRTLLQKHLSLPKQEECTACYGKGKYSVYKGDAVAGVDFPGDKPFVVEQGGVKEFPCPKCKGKQEQEDTTPIEKIQELDLAKLNLPLRGSIDALYKKQKEIIDTVNSLISKQTNE